MPDKKKATVPKQKTPQLNINIPGLQSIKELQAKNVFTSSVNKVAPTTIQTKEDLLKDRTASSNTGSMKLITKNQANKTAGWNEILSNPATALKSKIKTGTIPENFSKGEMNSLDHALNIVNPMTYVNAVGATAKNIASPIQTSKKLLKGAANLGLNLVGDDDAYEGATGEALGIVGDAVFAAGVVNSGVKAGKAINAMNKPIFKKGQTLIPQNKNGVPQLTNDATFNKKLFDLQPIPNEYYNETGQFVGKNSYKSLRRSGIIEEYDLVKDNPKKIMDMVRSKANTAATKDIKLKDLEADGESWKLDANPDLKKRLSYLQTSEEMGLDNYQRYGAPSMAELDKSKILYSGVSKGETSIHLNSTQQGGGQFYGIDDFRKTPNKTGYPHYMTDTDDYIKDPKFRTFDAAKNAGRKDGGEYFNSKYKPFVMGLEEQALIPKNKDGGMIMKKRFAPKMYNGGDPSEVPDVGDWSEDGGFTDNSTPANKNAKGVGKTAGMFGLVADMIPAGGMEKDIAQGQTQVNYGMSTGAATGKGALKGAQAGAALGPVGMAAGAIIGAVGGLVTSGAERKRERREQKQIDSMNILKYQNQNIATNINAYGDAGNYYMEEGGIVEAPQMGKGGFINKKGRYVHEDGKTTSRPGLWSNVHMKKKRMEDGGIIEEPLTEIQRFKGKGFTPEFKKNKELFSYMNTASNNTKINYNGVVGPDDVQIDNPTPYQSTFTNAKYNSRSVNEFNNHPSELRNGQSFPQSMLSEKMKINIPGNNLVPFAEDGMMIGEEGEQSGQEMPEKQTVNIESGEILIDPVTLEVIRKYDNTNRYKAHAKNPQFEAVGNFTQIEPGHVVISKKYAERFSKGDMLAKKSVILEILKNQRNNPTPVVQAPMAEAPQAANGMMVGPGPKNPYLKSGSIGRMMKGNAFNAEGDLLPKDEVLPAEYYEADRVNSISYDKPKSNILPSVNNGTSFTGTLPTEEDLNTVEQPANAKFLNNTAIARGLNFLPTAYGLAKAMRFEPEAYDENTQMDSAKSYVQGIETNPSINAARANMNASNSNRNRVIRNINSPSVRAEFAAGNADMIKAENDLIQNASNYAMDARNKKRGALADLEANQGTMRLNQRTILRDNIQKNAANSRGLIQRGLSEGVTNFGAQVMDDNRLRSVNNMMKYTKTNADGSIKDTKGFIEDIQDIFGKDTTIAAEMDNARSKNTPRKKAPAPKRKTNKRD